MQMQRMVHHGVVAQMKAYILTLANNDLGLFPD